MYGSAGAIMCRRIFIGLGLLPDGGFAQSPARKSVTSDDYEQKMLLVKRISPQDIPVVILSHRFTKRRIPKSRIINRVGKF